MNAKINDGLYVACFGCKILIAPQDIEDCTYGKSRFAPVMLCPACAAREAFEGDVFRLAGTYLMRATRQATDLEYY